MCFGAKPPKVPDPVPPPQAEKAPDSSIFARRNTNLAASRPGGSTLLTSPTGIDISSANVGASSLLGGGTNTGGY